MALALHGSGFTCGWLRLAVAVAGCGFGWLWLAGYGFGWLAMVQLGAHTTDMFDVFTVFKVMPHGVPVREATIVIELHVLSVIL